MIRAALAALLLFVTACSSSGGPANSYMPNGGSSYPSEPGNHLTGYGANIATWRATHTADPNLRLNPDCCFGPKVTFFGQGEPQDTWYALQIDAATGEVTMFSHAFAPHTSQKDAEASVIAKDLPSDATLVRATTGDGCRQYLYRSSQLAAQTHLGEYVLFFFVSPPDESVYYPDNIWNATVEPADANTDLTNC